MPPFAELEKILLTNRLKANIMGNVRGKANPDSPLGEPQHIAFVPNQSIANILTIVKRNQIGGAKLNVQKIKELCDARGLNFSQLEKAVGLGNGTIGKWKDSSPRVDGAKRVADFLGVTIDELVKEE